jgi:hypothetical protein
MIEHVNEQHLRFRREKLCLERILKYGGEIRNKKSAFHFICHIRPEVADFWKSNTNLAGQEKFHI